MKAIEVPENGGPEVLSYVERSQPSPGPGEVLIKSEAIGVNFIDTYFRSGAYPRELPFVLGTEVAGTVAAVGDGVTALGVDDRVVTAAASDGPHAFAGAFAPGTGADTGVRLSDAVARVARAAKPKELYPYGILRPRLRALSFAGALSRNLPAGLIKAEDPALIGQIGAPLLSHYRLRFDFPGGRLLLGSP